MKTLPYILISLLLGLTIGCAGLHRKAEKFYENGDYIAAAKTYEQALARDPEDALATENLRKVRQKLIEMRLIEARQLRLSDNYFESHRILMGVIEDQRRWSLSPAGAAFSAQTEEMEYLLEWLRAQVQASSRVKKYLRAKILTENYERAFQHSQFSSAYNQLEAQIEKGGKQHCGEIKAMATGYYSTEFAKHYCLFWGASDATISKKANLPVGYDKIQLIGEVSGLPKEALSSLSQSLLEGLKTTPYYKAGGKILPVQVTGNFTNTYSEQPSIGHFNYDEDVPFQDTRSVPYQEQEPYTAYKEEYDHRTQKNVTVPYTAYRSVTKYRAETFTNYRKESRTVSYAKTDFTADYKLAAHATFEVDKVSYNVPLNDQLLQSGSFHDTSNPRIGLHKKSKELMSEVGWIQKVFSTGGNLKRQLITDSWINKYCDSLQSHLTTGQSAEVILKCAAGAGRPPALVDNWSQEKFGLAFNELTRSIGL